MLLESEGLILRGDIRDRIPRSALGAARVRGEVLEIAVGRKRLVLELGAKAAAQWAKAVAKPPPSLAEKLGVGAGAKCVVFGRVDDPTLFDTLKGARTRSLASATSVVAVVLKQTDLDALAPSLDGLNLPLWCVYKKGKAAEIGDGAVRSFMRACGFIDNKSCGVSEQLTATRYVRAKSR